MCQLVSLQLHSFVAGFTQFYLHFRVVDSSHQFTACLLLVHGEFVGSIRTHLDLPLYRPFHCLALGNGLFATLLLYQRIVNLMAAVEGIGCHHLVHRKKKAELDHDLLHQIKFHLQGF